MRSGGTRGSRRLGWSTSGFDKYGKRVYCVCCLTKRKSMVPMTTRVTRRRTSEYFRHTMRSPLPTIALLHAVPNLRAPPPTNSLAPLYDFSNTATVDAWEARRRCDHGRCLLLAPRARVVVDALRRPAAFRGRWLLRQRMKLLAEPIDLSSADGIYVDCEVLDVGAAPSKRVWKMAIRTRQDRGGVVTSKPSVHPNSARRSSCHTTNSVWCAARACSGIPPLDAASTNETYQIISLFQNSRCRRLARRLMDLRRASLRCGCMGLARMQERPPPPPPKPSRRHRCQGR